MSSQASLLGTSLFSDVVVAVHEKKFHLHRCILATQSPVLKEMLEGKFSDAVGGTLVLTETPVDEEAFQVILPFLYGDSLKVTPGNVCKVYVAADYLQSKSLQKQLLLQLQEYAPEAQAVGQFISAFTESEMPVLLAVEMLKILFNEHTDSDALFTSLCTHVGDAPIPYSLQMLLALTPFIDNVGILTTTTLTLLLLWTSRHHRHRFTVPKEDTEDNSENNNKDDQQVQFCWYTLLSRLVLQLQWTDAMSKLTPPVMCAVIAAANEVIADPSKTVVGICVKYIATRCLTADDIVMINDAAVIQNSPELNDAFFAAIIKLCNEGAISAEQRESVWAVVDFSVLSKANLLKAHAYGSEFVPSSGLVSGLLRRQEALSDQVEALQASVNEHLRLLNSLSQLRCQSCKLPLSLDSLKQRCDNRLFSTHTWGA